MVRHFAHADMQPDQRKALRAALQDSQRLVVASANAVRQAADAVARSDAELTALRSQVEGLAWLAPAIAEHRAARIRAGAGSAKAGLPEKLLEARRERDLQVQELGEAEAANRVLIADHQQAQEEHTRAQSGRIAVITTILNDRAMATLAELRAVEKEATALRLSLIGYLNARAVSDGFPPGNLGMLRHDPHNDPLIAAYESHLPRPPDWSRWRRELLESADAELGGCVAK